MNCPIPGTEGPRTEGPRTEGPRTEGPRTEGPRTEGPEYTERLRRLEGVRWKRMLRVRAPYVWNLRRLRLGRTLEVGCGVGRLLVHLDASSVGVDHNPTSVEQARLRGLTAYTVDEFMASGHATPDGFDTVLAA